MSVEVHQRERIAEAVAAIQELCAFSGAARAFWGSYLAVLGAATGAAAIALLRDGPKETPGWQKVLGWPDESWPAVLARHAADLAETCVVQGSARMRAEEGGSDLWLAGMRLPAERPEEAWVAVLLIRAAGEREAEEALVRARLLAHLPAVQRMNARTDRSEVAVAHFASVLELISLLNEPKRFGAAAMVLCNELATRHQCTRVSLGWLRGEYVRLRALSHSERFDRKSEAVQAIETAMEEALDQDEILLWPAPETQRLVVRDHAALAAASQAEFLCSLPLQQDGEAVGVLCFERSSAPFPQVELRLLSLCGDMAVHRLADLEPHERWFGVRWAAAAREHAGKLLGPSHTGAKLAGLLGAAALAYAFLGRLDYHVEAPFTLAPEDVAFLSAPYTGYIDEVKAEVGSEMKKGEPLAALDTRDLLLEEAAALADLTRYQREAEKAVAADKIAEMRIAQAQADQAKAKLELLKYRREQSTLSAPFDSVVIEGDLKKKIGAPVRQGDVLFKVTRLDRMFIECEVREEDAHELRAGGTGEVAFASMPRVRFPVKIERIEPVAQVKESGNVVIVRCAIEGPRGDWWRPGMRGVAHLDAGRRSPWWKLTHRTADYLRMRFWW